MVDFDAAATTFAELLVRILGTGEAQDGRIIRDVYGRLSFVTRHLRDPRWDDLEQQAAGKLGAYATQRSQLLVSLADDAAGLERLLADSTIGIATAGGATLRMIDRRLAGDDWLMRPEPLATAPKRLVFYSVKGGVGRSTALAVAAADLAARGYNVLVIDLDLEAPGLGSLLLTSDQMPKYGAADWFAAVAAGASAELLLPDMTGSSAFTSARAVVDVVPAAGRSPGAYLSKLARAYMPGSAGPHYAGFSFSMKAAALVRGLLARRRYDAVLIDARAGLHETSGGLLLGLGARALLFGMDTYQTFDDFPLLFQAFAQAFDPVLGGPDLRDAFKMVHAKAPRDERDRRAFRERSWDVWSRTLYDDVEPASEQPADAFVFDLGDDSAPHYPLEIIGDEGYARFDPRTTVWPLSEAAYAPVFGVFLVGVRTLLDLP